MRNKLRLSSAATLLMLSFVLAGCSCEKKQVINYSQERASVQLVSKEQLSSILPQLSGWTTREADASTTQSNRKVSRAAVAYEKTVEEQTSTLNLEVIDAINDRSVFDPLAVMAHSDPNAEIGHKRGIEVQGYHGIEVWNVKDVSVVLALVVEDRFLVRLNGKHVSEAVVREWIQATDLKKLASLANSAAAEK